MLTQDVVVKLILQHIGGAKLKPSPLMDIEGLPSMVRTAPMASLVTSLSQYGSTGQEIRDNLLKNPRAESANKILSAIPQFESAVNTSTLTAPQKSIVQAAVDEFEQSVEDFLRHTNILSGKEIGDPLAEQSQAFIDLLDGIANGVSGTANAAWAAANAAWANAQAAFANAQSALDYALLATGAANLAGTYAVAANNSAASANSSASAANGYAFLAAGHASTANTAAFQANLAAVSANSSAASANSSAVLSANFAGQANSAAIVAQQFAADANASAANAAASLIITAGHAAAAAANAVAAQGFAVSANSSAANAASQVTLAAGHAAAANSSAAAAAANAVSAQSSATAANSSAASANASSTLAASHVTSARLTAASLIPSTFAASGTHFFAGYEGDPATRTPLDLTGIGSFPDVGGIGKVAQLNLGGAFDIGNIGVIQIRPGRTYRATFRYRSLTGTRPVDLYMIALDSDYVYVSAATTASSQTATTTWQTYTATATGDSMLAGGGVYIRAMGRATADGDAVQWSIIGVEDITEQTIAAAQAIIANAAAVSANNSAASANTSSTLSASYSTDAQKAALSSHPTTFEQGYLYFQGDAGNPAPNHIVVGTDGTYGPYLQTFDTTSYGAVVWKARVPSAPGKKWKVRALVSHVSGTPRPVELRLEQYLAATGGFRVDLPIASIGVVSSTTPVWVEAVITATATAHSFVVPSIVLNFPAPYQAVQRIYALELVDVDALEAATTQAGIATTQAAAATASAAAANTSQTLTATYRADVLRINGNFGFKLGMENWFVNDNGATGPISATGKYIVDTSIYGGSLRQNPNVTGSIFSGTLIPVDTSRKYRMRSRLHAWSSSGTTGATFYVGFVGCDANGNILDHGGYGSYRYSIWTGGAVPHGVHVSPSVIVTGEGNDSWLKFPPGTKFIRPMAILNYFSENTYTWIDGIFIEDATETETSTAQATIATNQATIATSQAAAAQSSAVLAASIGPGFLNKNAGFDDYPNPAVGQVPSSWLEGNFNTHNGYRVSDNQGGYAYRLPAAAGADAYIGQGVGNPGLQSVKQNDYFVLEADITLNSGSLSGSGLLLYTFDGSGSVVGQQTLQFQIEPDASGSAPGSGAAGQSYRFRKLVRATHANSFYLRIYAMSHWSTLGSTATANDITWHKCGVRPPTQAEIRDQTVLAPLEATVTTHSSAIATLDSRTASYWLKVSAGTGTATLAMQATDSGGVPATSITMLADVVRLGNSTSSTPSLAISNGVAQFTGELNVGTGSGARVNITKDLIRVYDANNVMRVRMGVW